MADSKATRAAYGEALVELGAINDRVVVLDGDLSSATYTKGFRAAYPDRFFEAGIAENDLVGLSAGLSSMGFIPFVSTFAMFGTGRAYEVVRNAIAYPHLNVKLACTHAGITVGEDGASHQCIEDLALMRVIPGMTVVVPSDANQSKKAVMAAAEFEGPMYLRFSRPAQPVLPDQPFEIGKANVLRDGTDIVFFACGYMVDQCLKAAEVLAGEGVNAAVVNVHTIKPIDREKVLEYARKCGKVVTAEDHSVIGGLGDAVAEVLVGNVDCKFKKVGIQDRFGQSGKVPALLEEYGLSVDGVVAQAKEIL